MKVAQAMSTSFKCIPGATSLDKAMEAVLEAPHSIVPVVDDAGVYTGIISPLDFFRRYFPLYKEGPYPDLHAIFGTTVALLARGCRTVSSSDTIQEAANLMLLEKSYELPVVDKGHVVGIISAQDILAYLKKRGSLE